MIFTFQVAEHFENLIDNLTCSCWGSINLNDYLNFYLVDNDYWLDVSLQSLSKDEFCLGHRAFSSTDNQANTIDHTHDTLDLTPEIMMARGIDNVDLVSIVTDVGTLGQDCNTFFSFKLVGIHGAFLAYVHSTESEHGVDQGGFTVIDVSNDCDIPDFLYEFLWCFC